MPIPPRAQTQDVDVPLDEFGGLVTELSPADIPMGASPLCQDVDFFLGQVFTRAGLRSMLVADLPVNATCNYLKTFLLPNTNNEMLILDGQGNFYYEDVTNAPGSVNLIGKVTGGSFANSATQFGREWLAFHDNNWGFDAPRQWDGQFFDRVSQDGPGTAPAVSDELAPLLTISSAPAGANMAGGVATWSAAEVGNIVTLTLTTGTAAPLGLLAGDKIVVAAFGVGGYNGTFTINSVNSAGTVITYTNATTGLGPSSGGTVSYFLANINTTSPHGFGTPGTAISGLTVIIAGVGVGGYNGTWPVRAIFGTNTFVVAISTSGLGSSGSGTVTVVGNITAGVHEVVQIFLTRQGYLTKPSPIGSWTAAGGKRAVVSNLAIGPANVIARWLAFTSSGGAFFFAIPIPTTGSETGTVVNDNTSTTFTVDFSDATLLNAFSIDSDGGNLFRLEVLGPSAGVISYSNRMFYWGERNKLQNFLNLSFDGGFDPTNTFPLGWAVSASSSGGGTRANPGVIFGFGYKITSDGVIGHHCGSIEQSAAADSFGVAILSPSTKYSVRFAAAESGTLSPGGQIVFEFYSPTSGSLATATVNINSMNTLTQYFSANFSAQTPSVVPFDTVLRVYMLNAAAGGIVSMDEVEIYPTLEPYISTSLRVSYSENPESFDGETGVIGVSNFDGKIIRSCFQLRDTLYIVKDGSLYVTQDNGSTEPFQWTVSTVSQVVGTPSLRGVAVAEEYAFIVNQLGVYLFNGSEPVRINQEIKPVSDAGQGWDTINWAHGEQIWVVADISNRHLLIGAPTGVSTVCNQIFMMNYRELDESYSVASSKTVHMSYTGKMVNWDMSRKWCQWTIQANCGAIVTRQDDSLQVWLGNSAGNGKIYYLDKTQTSDDGVVIPWKYFTSFFVSRDMEQGLGVGTHRHLYTYMTTYTTGSGILSLSMYGDSLNSGRVKALAPRTMSATLAFDLELGVNFTSDRASVAFLPDGNVGTVFQLSKMTLSMRTDPHIPVRGRA